MGSTSPRYDIKKLAEELEFGIEDISTLFSKYTAEIKERISQMEDCLNRKDWNTLERVVHNIKGVSINLNIVDVYEKAVECDSLLKENRTENADTYIKELILLLVDSENEIRKIFSGMDIEL